MRGAEKCTDVSKSLSITCQLSLDGERRDCPFSLRMPVPIEFWKPSQNGNWVDKKFYNAEKYNESLRAITLAFEDILNYLRLTDEEITYKNLRKYFDFSTFSMIAPSKKTYPLLLDMYDEMVENTGRKKQWKKNTYDTYNSRRSNIVLFLKEKGLEKIRINEVRYKFFEALETWLMERGCVCRNYANKILGSVKKTISYAVNAEYLDAMTIGNLDLTYDPPKAPCYLLPYDRDKIISYQGSTYKKLRDISVFLMYTGFSWIDYEQLTEQHCLEAGWKKERHKTGVFSLPPIMDEAMDIIVEYGGVDNLPKMHLTDFNKKLKFFGDKLGIVQETVGFNLTSSVFRDTFCSMMENEYFVDHRTLMAMMGHTNPKQIRNYSSLMPAKIKHELDKQLIRLKRKVAV